MQRFVLTGGHGVGKSSLIAALELRGEHVSHEAAATIRRLGRAGGDPFPEDASPRRIVAATGSGLVRAVVI